MTSDWRRSLCFSTLLWCAPCCSIEARLPCVGSVSSATRTLRVIGTVHTPSRQQLGEVAQLIRSTRPDVVLVELDQPRLERLLEQQQVGGQPTLGAELAEAVAVAAACDIPVVLGDAVLPLDGLWRGRPFIDGARLRRASRLRLRRHFPDVEVRRVSVGRTFAADPQKAAPLLLSVGLTILLLAAATAVPASADAAAAPLPGSPSPLTVATSALLLLLPLAMLLRFVDVLLLSRDETLSENALRALEIGARLRGGQLLRRRFRFSTQPQTLAALNEQLLPKLLRRSAADAYLPRLLACIYRR